MRVLVGLPTLLLALLLTATAAHAAGQASCRVSYSSNTKLPLIFGGVNQGCQGLRCQSRLGPLGAKCGAQDGSSWGVCTADQATYALNFARQTMGEAATSLSPCELMRYLQGRTMWLLGDSHTKTLWSALQCFLIDFWDHNVCAVSTDEAAVEELAALPTKVRGNANCIHLMGPAGGRVCMMEVVLGSSLINASLPSGGVIPLLRKKFAAPQDIFVVQFGAWHRKNLADMSTYEPSLVALGEDRQANKGWPHLLFREPSAAHPKDMDARVCTPNNGYSLVGGRLLSTPAADADDQSKYVMNRPLAEIANSILPKFGVPIIHSFNLTVPLFNQHIEMRHVDALDCLHYCAPGVPQMWILQLYAALASGQGGVTPLQPVARVPGFGGGSTVVEERGGGVRGGQQQQQQQQAGGRLLELLRLGRRRLQGDAEDDATSASLLWTAPGGRQLRAAAQRPQCVRPKVVF